MKKAVVLGGYGLIGAAIMRALETAGFEVTGVGRSPISARRSAPDANWHIADLTQMSVEDWQALLKDKDIVINAAGALQDGGKDTLEHIHVEMIDRLIRARPDVRLVQISAAGVHAGASTHFFRSKARGDALVTQLAQDWVILRPTLVLAPDAYGGTALLRAAAALPWLALSMFPDAKMQTVHIDDVADAAVKAASGGVPSGTIADLTEDGHHDFQSLLARLRHWQGFPPAKFQITPPRVLVQTLSKIADGLGYLGWRSPLRSTAMQALSDGIQGDPKVWHRATGHSCRSFTQSLERLPATRQERMFARGYLALPVIIATLSLFWILSGGITLLDVPRAVAVLADSAISHTAAWCLVIGGATADIILGLAILWRRAASRAACGMVALAASYLLASLVTAPHLWADPLGPMVKVFPTLTLAALVPLLLEER